MFEKELNEHGSLEQTVAAVCMALKPLAMVQTCLSENPDLFFTAHSSIMVAAFVCVCVFVFRVFCFFFCFFFFVFLLYFP